MGIGTDYSNNGANNQKATNDINYYSRFKIRSKDNRRSLGITYWGGLMIIEINDVDVNNGFKPVQKQVIRLSINKAKILSYELKRFKEYLKGNDIDPNKAFGVSSGLGNELPYIGFSATLNDNNEKVVGITIGKLDQNGNIVSAETFMIDNTDFLYGLEWNNISQMDVEKVSYPNVELDLLINAIEDFANNMSGALAYSFADLTRYDTFRMNKRFDSIFDKLGIERVSSGNKSYGGGNNFLNNLASRSSNSTTMDDIEGLLDD